MIQEDIKGRETRQGDRVPVGSIFCCTSPVNLWQKPSMWGESADDRKARECTVRHSEVTEEEWESEVVGVEREVIPGDHEIKSFTSSKLRGRAAFSAMDQLLPQRQVFLYVCMLYIHTEGFIKNMSLSFGQLQPFDTWELTSRVCNCCGTFCLVQRVSWVVFVLFLTWWSAFL